MPVTAKNSRHPDLDVFLDGYPLSGALRDSVIRSIRNRKYTCVHCENSGLHLQRVYLTLELGPTVLFYWCNDCRQINKFSEYFSSDWHMKLMGKLF